MPTLYQNPKSLAIECVDNSQILRSKTIIKFEDPDFASGKSKIANVRRLSGR